MPNTPTEWAWFTFYTLGSAGGIVFLVMFAYEIGMGWRIARKRRRAGV